MNFNQKIDGKMEEKNIRTKELFDKFYLHERGLTAGQLDFIRSCKKQFNRNKELSEKQISVLNDIAKHFYALKAEFNKHINNRLRILYNVI